MVRIRLVLLISFCLKTLAFEGAQVADADGAGEQEGGEAVEDKD